MVDFEDHQIRGERSAWSDDSHWIEVLKPTVPVPGSSLLSALKALYSDWRRALIYFSRAVEAFVNSESRKSVSPAANFSFFIYASASILLRSFSPSSSCCSKKISLLLAIKNWCPDAIWYRIAKPMLERTTDVAQN